jgi:hypothetical protein
MIKFSIATFLILVSSALSANSLEVERSSLYCSIRQDGGYLKLRINGDQGLHTHLQHRWTEFSCDPKGKRYRFSLNFANSCKAGIKKISINNSIGFANDEQGRKSGLCFGQISHNELHEIVQSLRLAPSRVTVRLETASRVRGGYILVRDSAYRKRLEDLYKGVGPSDDPLTQRLVASSSRCEDAIEEFADACF